jgi:hypothetical protein
MDGLDRVLGYVGSSAPSIFMDKAASLKAWLCTSSYIFLFIEGGMRRLHGFLGSQIASSRRMVCRAGSSLNRGIRQGLTSFPAAPRRWRRLVTALLLPLDRCSDVDLSRTRTQSSNDEVQTACIRIIPLLAIGRHGRTKRESRKHFVESDSMKLACERHRTAAWGTHLPVSTRQCCNIVA